jgi:CubicO group peptidase (beta-lactamase class C family)
MSATRMTRRDCLAATSALALLPLRAFAATQPPVKWTNVQALLDGYVAKRKYAAVAAALSFGGSPVAYPIAGTLAFDVAVPVNKDTLFRIYSITKPVTGVATMLLVEDGRLTLDQPVSEVFPELGKMQVAIDPAKGLESRPATRPITIRQLLTHTSGLSSWLPFLGDTPIAKAYRTRGMTPGDNLFDRPEYGPQVGSLRELIKRLPEVPLVAEPGTAWNYSMGLDVMGAVIEKVSGMPFDRFLRQRLFEPLDMRSTGFQVATQDAARLTTLYGNRDGRVAVLDGGANSNWLKPARLPAGGGGLVSSARDFIRLGQVMLREGALGGIRVMKPETARLAMSNLLPPGIKYPVTGGFGAGAAVVMPGVASPNGGPGVYSALGSSSTLLSVDPVRKGTAVFLTQFMPGVGPSGDAVAFRGEFNAAIDADLKA